MNMKIFFVFGIALGALSCSSSKQEGVKLIGQLESFATGGFAYVERVGENGVEPYDTLTVDANGSFEEYLAIDKPAFYRLNFNGKQILSLILTGKETEVVVNADGNDPRGFWEISGSYDTEYKNQMDELIKGYQSKMQETRQVQLNARTSNDVQAFQTAQQQMLEVAKETEKELKILIRKSSPSLAAFYGMQMIDATQNFAFMDSIANELHAEMPENFHVANMISQIATQRSLSIGKVAPEITLQNPDGEEVKLSSLRGKYVLIDFWAAWCGPCRRENPNVVRVYNTYAGDNFEILGVSLDKTREKWLGAIEQDGLPWLHVSDLKFWRSQAAIDYQVTAIPATFLIDPEGKIIAKNLRGASLEAKLKEIFG